MLYFDKFIFEEENFKKAVALGEYFSKVIDSSGTLFKKNIDEVEFLIKNGLIEFYKPIEPKNCVECDKILDKADFQNLIKKISTLDDYISQLLEKLANNKEKFHSNFQELLTKTVDYSDFHSILSLLLLNSNGQETTPLIEHYSSLSIDNNTKSDAVNLTINKFPYIDDSIS